jgi:Flp pilus assembly protein TadD
MWNRNPTLRSRAVLIGVFFWALVSLHAQQPAAQDDYVVVVLKGTARITRAGTQVAELVTTNQILRIGDRVKVDPQSQLALRKGHLQVHRFDENSEFEIEPPRAPAGPKTRLNLFSGIYNFFHRDKPTELEVRTQSRSAACRGTEFNVQVDPDGTMTVTVIDGIVDLIDPQAAATLTLTNGQQGVVGPGRAPSRSPAIDTVSIIQWTFYYPGVLDTRELPLSEAERATLDPSITSYESGDLLAALASYPAGRVPQSDAERIYRAALLLTVGQVDDAQPLLSAVNRAAGDINSRLAAALEQMIAVVKQRAGPRALSPEFGTEWMVESYRQQLLTHLSEALAAARQATEKSPVFGFARERVAELEFSHGRRDESIRALESALEFSPRNAQGVALNGFLFAARNSIRAAIAEFDRAIAIDSGLPNAWLGRGLCRIRLNDLEGGRDDLLVAAALEPQRSFLRSYLGKAWTDSRKPELAKHELELAKNLDKNDPTAWLYSALLKQQQNKINDAIRDLEHAQDHNPTRAVYRSKFLLDQDRAVRGANLAHIYRDAGMKDWSVLEAGRAVANDYANYSAHLFLANSYDELRDPNRINLRYETPSESEYLIANLLAPVGAGTLSQTISQGEYSKLFERNRLGMVSRTEYLSRGAWYENGAQFGTFGNTSYALEALYRTDPGQRPNNDFYERELRFHFKQQLTPDDTIYLRLVHYESEGGDRFQYYDPASANTALRTKESQEPTLTLGYHHQWNPDSHFLLTAARFEDTYEEVNPFVGFPLRVHSFGDLVRLQDLDASLALRSETELYSIEAQQIWQQPRNTIIVGSRFQAANFDVQNSGFVLGPGASFILTDQFGDTVTPALPQVSTDSERLGIYLYDSFRPLDQLTIEGGIVYEHLKYPENIRTVPMSDAESTMERFLPKAGFVWTPGKGTALRGAYTRSLGGASLEQSVRIEPTEVAGFNQAFRSIVPETLVGGNAGALFETYHLSLEHRFQSGTYAAVGGQLLYSTISRTRGAIIHDEESVPIIAAQLSELHDKVEYRERSLSASMDQFIGSRTVIGASYRLTDATYRRQFSEISSPRDHDASLLHRLDVHALYNDPSGFFGQIQTLWYLQDNYLQDNQSLPPRPELAGDEFWHLNVFVGYRFWQRRAQVTLGILNLTDQDYRLNPLVLYNELPRSRTFMARLDLSF